MHSGRQPGCADSEQHGSSAAADMRQHDNEFVFVQGAGTMQYVVESVRHLLYKTAMFQSEYAAESRA